MKVALADSFIENVDPHLALPNVEFVDVAEPRVRGESIGFVLIDDDLGMVVLDRVEGGHE